MVQKWYNRIMWTSGLVAMGGMLIILPILMLSETGRVILEVIVIFIPISSMIFVLGIFGDIFWDCKHYSAWINHRDCEPLDRSG